MKVKIFTTSVLFIMMILSILYSNSIKQVEGGQMDLNLAGMKSLDDMKEFSALAYAK